MLEKGAIEMVQSCKGKFISNLFLVPTKSGGFRPVINLKPLNHFELRWRASKRLLKV